MSRIHAHPLHTNTQKPQFFSFFPLCFDFWSLFSVSAYLWGVMKLFAQEPTYHCTAGTTTNVVPIPSAKSNEDPAPN